MSLIDNNEEEVLFKSSLKWQKFFSVHLVTNCRDKTIDFIDSATTQHLQN